jgi:hypothetical protein
MVVSKAIKLRKRKRENEENTESKIIFQAKRLAKIKLKMSRKYKRMRCGVVRFKMTLG